VKVVAIIQARMGSTRFPGKIFKNVLGKPLLDYQFERLKRSKSIAEIVIATTTNKSDQEIVNFCRSRSISYYRGSENDVLARYYETAKKYKADVIVRITSDCPLIDPAIVDKVVVEYLKDTSQDYVSNTLERTYPRGMDTEVFPFSLLEEMHREAKSLDEREHVTTYIYNHPEQYRIKQVKQVKDDSHYRLTVDTIEDFKVISKIIEFLYKDHPLFSLHDVICLLKEKPDIAMINQHIEQKKL
jgi:spore coat polysaccharide biosynthesis protein SpsF